MTRTERKRRQAEQRAAEKEICRIAAAHAVFNTFELRETILLMIPREDVASLRCVNKNWHEMISRSRPLRKKLFLIPDGTPSSPLEIDDDPTSAEYAEELKLNPFAKMKAVFHHFDPHGVFYLTKQPLDRPTVVSIRHKGTDSVRYLDVKIQVPNIRNMECPPVWLDLPITQPPVRAVDLGMYGYGLCWVFNADPSGVTFRDIIETGRRVEEQGNWEVMGGEEYTHYPCGLTLKGQVIEEEARKMDRQCKKIKPDHTGNDKCGCMSSLQEAQPSD